MSLSPCKLLLSIFFLSQIWVLEADEKNNEASFELGIGTFLFSAPDYLGSSYSQTVLLPFPMIKYRGKNLKIDNGIKLQLLDDSGFQLSISGNGSLPSSDENKERIGMDLLDATVELGPSLDYLISENKDAKLWLHVPLRFTYAIGDNSGYKGKLLNPKISWRKPAKQKGDWRLGLSAGLVYANEELNDYYYSVKIEESTAMRPAYKAKSGYTGLRTEFTYSKRVESFWIGGFVRYDNLSNGVNLASPLVSTKENWTAGIALSWVFSEG